MMRNRMAAVCAAGCVAFGLSVLPALAQTPANPFTGASKMSYDRVKDYLTKSAEQMPEANYAFKPTPDVRSFGQLVGHVADANYMICSAVAGEKPAGESIEKTKTAKADLQKALADSFAYCDKVYAGMTDSTGLQTVNFFGGQQPKLAVLSFVNNHGFEHYGNIITYMRLKGLVPPSSQKPSM
jgi:uncharacterized damage-inducible protein DinB